MYVLVLGLLAWIVTKVEYALLVHLQEPRAKNSFYFTVKKSKKKKVLALIVLM